MLGSVIPLTLIVIFATNNALRDPQLDIASDRAAQLLTKWNRLHALRTVAGFAAFVLFVLHLAGVL